MRCHISVFFIISIFSNGAHAGEIFRCVAANGDVMFTNMTCPANSQVQHFASYEPVPDIRARTNVAAENAASAASAMQAREAAQQATAAAYQARMAYEQAQAEDQDEQSSDENEYAGGWIPFYPQRDSHWRNRIRHPRRAMAAQSAMHATHQAPRAQGATIALHR